MTKLTIGIGEDFPVEDKQGGEGCRSHRRRHHRGEMHARWHRWLHERFGRRDKKDDMNTKKKDGE